MSMLGNNAIGLVQFVRISDRTKTDWHTSEIVFTILWSFNSLRSEDKCTLIEKANSYTGNKNLWKLNGNALFATESSSTVRRLHCKSSTSCHSNRALHYFFSLSNKMFKILHIYGEEKFENFQISSSFFLSLTE